MNPREQAWLDRVSLGLAGFLIGMVALNWFYTWGWVWQ